ncbi:MAG: agmatinase [Ardenticatenales bacterium]|nr:agmatinase [Ardenticatenales bacterium]
MSYDFSPQENFLGLDEESSALETARVLVLPIPYEGTVSYGGGTKFGPRAIIHASMQVELFDREFGKECASEYGVHTLPALASTHHSPETMVRYIEEAVYDMASRYPDKLLFVLGGEHSISSGVGRGLARAHNVDRPLMVQLDAHSDLRNEYEGTPFSHASIARRLLDDGWDIIQLGIRSICTEEMELITARHDHLRVWFAEQVHADASWEVELTQRVHGRDVFLSIDIDALDPSLIPATGTPEPDGLTWNEALRIIHTVTRNAGRLIGADCVELAPIPGHHASEFITAKLIYKTINHIMAR